jgi:hypothetical protein
MAIFIVDQFSLNTDLPLDIRYVPSAGRFDPDISVYKYPGMQAYDTTTQTVWYCDNSLNWNEFGGDASLGDLWSIVTDLSTYVGSQVASLDASIQAIDLSIGDIYVRLQTLDGSVFTLDSSVRYLFNWNASQDASIAALQAKDASIDASLGLLNNWNLSQDASIAKLQAKDASIDASLGLLNNWDISQDASIAILQAKDASLDSSIGTLNLWNVNQDTSISSLNNLISGLESSLGLYVEKAGDTMTGPLTITAGGLSVGSIVTPVNASIFGSLYVNQNLGVKGDLIINGSLYVVGTEQVDVSSAYIHLNTGLVGPPPSTLQSGIIIGRGSSEPYVFIFDETNQTFRIGIAANTSTGYLDASTQAVATRQDEGIIVNNGIAVWNDAETKFDTYTQLTYNGSVFRLDASLNLPKYAGGTDLMLVVGPDGTVRSIPTSDGSINNLYLYIDGSLALRDTSIAYLNAQRQQLDASIIRIDGSIVTLFDRVNTIDSSITYIESSINQLFAKDASSIKGGINIGDGSAGVFAGIDSSMNLQFREIKAGGAIVVSQDASTITISFDSSTFGDIISASNVAGGDASIFLQKSSQDLQFRSFKSLDPSNLMITNDASFVYFDVSISGSFQTLADVCLGLPLVQHQIAEFDTSVAKWVNSNNIWWDISLGTTTNDLHGIPAGTNLDNLTLKQVLFKMLYQYQVPTLSIGASVAPGTYEKGLASTQFASIDVTYNSTNANYPIALLDNVHISKTAAGVIYNASLGLVPSASGLYTDGTGITNWAGISRTISYNVTIDDDQLSQGHSQPAVGASESYTFWYRQYWGMVGDISIGQINSPIIKGLVNSRLTGETNLLATFDNSVGGFVKYIFAYPDTIAAPDNFGTLTQIIDQNTFDMTSGFETQNVDVSVGVNNVRYRVYLLKNKVNTPTFNITFKF